QQTHIPQNRFGPPTMWTCESSGTPTVNLKSTESRSTPTSGWFLTRVPFNQRHSCSLWISLSTIQTGTGLMLILEKHSKQPLRELSLSCRNGFVLSTAMLQFTLHPIRFKHGSSVSLKIRISI